MGMAYTKKSFNLGYYFPFGPFVLPEGMPTLWHQ